MLDVKPRLKIQVTPRRDGRYPAKFVIYPHEFNRLLTEEDKEYYIHQLTYKVEFTKKVKW